MWAVIAVILLIGISEIYIRITASHARFFSLSDAALLVWGLIMFSGGVFSLLSYFFETRWKGFHSLIWVYKTIIPVGGKVNAIIFGLIGILIGSASIIRVIAIYFLLLTFFLSSINLDNLSISSGLVL